MANPYDVRVQNAPAITVMRIVASGMSRRGVWDSSATGATLSTPAIDRNAKIAARLSPENPAVAARGSKGLPLKWPSAPPLITITSATAAMNVPSATIRIPMTREDSLMLLWFRYPMMRIEATPPPIPVQVVADTLKYVSSALKNVPKATGYSADTTT